jgi:hypothetical protein
VLLCRAGAADQGPAETAQMRQPSLRLSQRPLVLMALTKRPAEGVGWDHAAVGGRCCAVLMAQMANP